MSTFSREIKEVINTFKHLYRKQHEDDAIGSLGLRRRELQSASDLSLYYKALKIIDIIDADQASPDSDHALENFSHSLKKMINEYYLDKDQVLHSRQQASRALLNAIQVMSLAPDRLTDSASKRLEKLISLVIKYGTDEHKNHLKRALKIHLPRKRLFFMVLLNHFENESRQRKGQA